MQLYPGLVASRNYVAGVSESGVPVTTVEP